MKYFLKRAVAKFFYLRNSFITPRFPDVEDVNGGAILGLGSNYGKKFILNADLGNSPLLVSGGVGEDISFDVEFISKFNGVVHLFDPTPRAIKHFVDTQRYFGENKSEEYSEDGSQSPLSYNLKR